MKYKVIILTLLIISFLSCKSFAQNSVAPNEFTKICPQAHLIGSSDLNFLGLKVCKISLWSEDKNFSYDKKFAIEILYNMNFSKEDLARRSIEEIKKTTLITQTEENSYHQTLLNIFSDIKTGDQKLAIFDPEKGVKLFHNQKFKGQISDPKLARLFINIWLNENGSYPKVTKKLLGK